MGLLDQGGILGTGICLSKECKDRLNAQSQAEAQYQAGLGAALAGLSTPKKDNTVTIIVIVSIVALIALGVTVFILTRKK